MKQNQVQQKEIRLGMHGEHYGSWMSNPVFYVVGALLALSVVLAVLSFTVFHIAALGVLFSVAAAALTWPDAEVTGIDYWGAAYGYGQAMCEKNAASEGAAARCVFKHGDANKLDFPDESFDAVVSNYAYYNVMGADKQALLLETLRVLKKGGVFALNDEMKPHMYGNMEAFAQELRDMGYADVRLIDTAQEAFGSRRRAAMMMLGDSRMLVGRK